MLSHNSLENNTFAFLSQEIHCNNHSKEIATSLCIDCKTFCCLTDSCGQKHIFHEIENLEYLLNNQIFPFLRNFLEMNKSSDNHQKVSNLNTFKQNLKNFAITEKRKTDDFYKKILEDLEKIYKTYLDGINDFIETISARFDYINQKLDYGSNSESKKLFNLVLKIEEYINRLLKQHYNNSEGFVISIAKDCKSLNSKMNEMKKNIPKIDFDKEIADIKNYAETEYGKLSKIDYFINLHETLVKDLNTIEMSKKPSPHLERSSISKVRRMVSLSGNKHNIDTDIFVRDLADTINNLRSDPNQALSLLRDYIGEDLNDTVSYDLNTTNRFNGIANYVSMILSRGLHLSPLEWDNDLSNSAEDYLTQTQGKIGKEDFKDTIKSMILSYYDRHTNINSLTYIGTPKVEKIIIKILSENDFIFDPSFNQIGICAVNSPYRDNHIVLIINLSYLSK